ncbi:hypothetical protein TNCV_4615981 [Trichonephila clavipes]|nr:hypothetical protein TNCV_4615981 [Trichonephila clavipes]
MSDIGPFPGYFLDDKQYHSRARSVGVYNPMTDRTYSQLRIVRMPSPVQSKCDAHDTIANEQYGAVWSMGHTQQVCVRIVLLPSNVWQNIFKSSALLKQQETDLTPAELWCTCSFLLIYDDISVFCRRRTSNTTSPVPSTTHSSSFK